MHPPVACLGRARVSHRRVIVLPTHPVVFRSIADENPVSPGKFRFLTRNLPPCTKSLLASHFPANQKLPLASPPSGPRTGDLFAASKTRCPYIRSGCPCSPLPSPSSSSAMSGRVHRSSHITWPERN